MLDIMMVTFNRLGLTQETLSSLIETTQTPFNLILVDNGSTDGTPDFLEKFCQEWGGKGYFESYKIIRNTKNLGIAIGRNQALEKSTREWMATLDNDVKLPLNWAGQSIEILQKNSNYAAIGVNFEDVTFPLVTSGGVEFQRKEKGNLGTACMLFHRKLHKMLGYFSTDYKMYAHEDADFGARIRVLKLELGYLAENGQHLGSGAQDQGEYREFKNAAHRANLAKFNQNCRQYFGGIKPIYLPFKL